MRRLSVQAQPSNNILPIYQEAIRCRVQKRSGSPPAPQRRRPPPPTKHLLYYPVPGRLTLTPPRSTFLSAGRRRRVDGGHALHQHAVCCDGLLCCGLGVARHFQDRSVTCPRHASQAYFCGLDVAHNRDSAEDTAKDPSSSGGAGRRQLKTKYGRASCLCLGPLRPRWAGHRRERDRQVRELAEGRAPRVLRLGMRGV